MLVLEPIYHQTIWGGTRLKKMISANCDCVGHLYSVFCRPGISNKVLNGVYSGKTLNDIFGVWKSKFGMEMYDYFPLTIALTEAEENLSIQVHPTDLVADTLEHGAHGKRESWYFLEAPYTGTIFNGCACKTEQEKARLLAEGKYLELADSLPIQVGDYVFVEPGTLHAITAGSLVYEIEEGGDFTYRIYDYDRLDKNGLQRELHLEKAIQTLDIKKRSIVKSYPQSGEIWEKTYVTRKLNGIFSYKNSSGTLECLTLVSGELFCDDIHMETGMTAILWPDEMISGSIELAFVARLRME